ncbi:MAG: helix-turn-helix transcriptional regulator [Phycisphaerales bacterium]|nr:helix-turn-helix transcriptional regulator [Phycisphaerales bacterium]MCB9835794.1 helix-turn-helix transcriptional regulator [Phycisphaera sp.]
MSPALLHQTDPQLGYMSLTTETVILGSHTFPVEHREWSEVRTFADSPIVAFARTPIEVTFGHEQPAMLNGAVVATPPTRTDYVRSPRTAAGHHAVWCRLLDPRTTAEIVSRFDPSAADRVEAPFARSISPSHPIAAHTAEQIAQAASLGRLPDPLELDEAVIRIIEAIAERCALAEARKPRAGGETQRQRRQAVNAACEYMALRFEQPLSIAHIADATAYSPAFLSRCFRESLGHTMHEHLTTLRLREAVHLLADRHNSIAQIAHTTGFASHAHLTTTLRSKLGTTPSSIAHACQQDLRALLDLLAKATIRLN